MTACLAMAYSATASYGKADLALVYWAMASCGLADLATVYSVRADLETDWVMAASAIHWVKADWDVALAFLLACGASVWLAA
ncbi:hypothetical protein NDK47_16595 [Brevibacillus ruminantium]|uniref:Uncharacterized protein n=1 Tax=Brevibacillus ruminantium TaxID=2950604 RepID=A0ABY4W9B7_9BACL|nr:hypothetical protein [Brevibacillus ruminantium]USG63786.1 hypothetical protein NDK47_16595 [Brevibacillus ruminantium]